MLFRSGTQIYFQYHKKLSYLLPISQIAFRSTSNITNLIHIYFQYHQKLSMDPYDFTAYFKNRDAEDTYIVNRFIQRRKKLEEGSGSGSGSRKKNI